VKESEQTNSRKNPTETHEAPPFFPMLAYILARIDAQPRTKWLNEGTAPIPYGKGVMNEVKIFDGSIEVLINSQIILFFVSIIFS